LNQGASEVDGNGESHAGEALRAVGLPLDADGVLAAVEDLIVGRDVLGGVGAPSGGAAILDAFECEQIGDIRTGSLLRGQGDGRADDGCEKSSHAEHHTDRRRYREASKRAVIFDMTAAQALRRSPYMQTDAAARGGVQAIWKLTLGPRRF
jgi:hypothetical protein